MKTIDLKARAAADETGESIFGLEHTGSHACYMIYGIIKPGENNRLIKPGLGHEEMIIAVKGNLEMTGHVTGTLTEGCAFHLKGDASVYLENKGNGPAEYVISGGHSGHERHH